MLTSRRKFLKCGAMAAAAAGFLLKSPTFAQQSPRRDPRTIFEIPIESKRTKTFYFNQNTFEPYLNTEFRVTEGEKVIRLKLVRVQDRTVRPSKNAPKQVSGECFSLLFQASDELSIVRQTHVLDHDALGQFTLFLVRADDEKRGICYEAIINRVPQ